MEMVSMMSRPSVRDDNRPRLIYSIMAFSVKEIESVVYTVQHPTSKLSLLGDLLTDLFTDTLKMLPMFTPLLLLIMFSIISNAVWKPREWLVEAGISKKTKII
jgi:hypothetical protein